MLQVGPCVHFSQRLGIFQGIIFWVHAALETSFHLTAYICIQVQRDMQRAPDSVQLDEEGYVKGIADKTQSLADVGQKLEYLLVTGNLQSRGGLDLSQASGFTIVAERLNFFRCARKCWQSLSCFLCQLT